MREHIGLLDKFSIVHDHIFSFGQNRESSLKGKDQSRFFKIRLGLYSKKFEKCLINYLGLSYEQTVASQLYLLVNHHRDHSSLPQSL
jgi:hypothetical protein